MRFSVRIVACLSYLNDAQIEPAKHIFAILFVVFTSLPVDIGGQGCWQYGVPAKLSHDMLGFESNHWEPYISLIPLSSAVIGLGILRCPAFRKGH